MWCHTHLSYFRIGFDVIQAIFEYLVRTDGRSYIGMIMSLTGLAFNIVFDYIFVAVFRLGTLGAAWGTFLSITVSMLIGFIYFLKYSHIRFCRPKTDMSILLKSCTNGSSEMLTEMSTGITTFYLILLSCNILVKMELRL